MATNGSATDDAAVTRFSLCLDWISHVLPEALPNKLIA
jgi:hypothetical protein